MSEYAGSNKKIVLCHLQNIFADLYATSISNNESENEVSLDSDSRAPKKATVKQTGHDPEMVLLYLLI